MPDDVPPIDLVFNSDCLNLIGNRFQLFRTIRDLRRSSETGQIDSHASEAAQHPVNNGTPELAAGRHAVNKQNRMTRSSRNQIQEVLLLPQRRISLAIRLQRSGVCRVDKRSMRIRDKIQGTNQKEKWRLFPPVLNARIAGSCSMLEWYKPLLNVVRRFGF